MGKHTRRGIVESGTEEQTDHQETHIKHDQAPEFHRDIVQNNVDGSTQKVPKVSLGMENHRGPGEPLDDFVPLRGR